MNKSIAMLHLNVASIREYLGRKNLGLLLGFLLVFMFLMDSPATAVGIFMMYGVFYSSYPFAVAEKNPLDLLYLSLPLPQKSLVAGHYLFALMINLVTGASAFALCTLVAMLRGKATDPFELLFTVMACFFICSLLELFQYPFFFQLGYQKARLIIFLPILLILPAISLLESLFRRAEGVLHLAHFLQWAGENFILLLALLLLFFLLCLFLSFRLSLRFYSRREF